MEKIRVKLKANSPHSEYGYYNRGDKGYCVGFSALGAIIILDNGKFAQAELKSIECIDEKQEWSDEDNRNLNIVSDIIDGKIAVDEAMKEGAIDWLKSLRPQPKYEWTEKDEINRDLIYNALNHVYDLEHNKSLCDWLNSLKPNHWKPTDEQIKALRWILNNIPYDSHKEEISGLLEQIKKL